VVTVSFLTALLFFGGWHFPGLSGPVDAGLGGMLLRTFVLVAKVSMVVAFIMLLRWALPRFRFDQLMGLAWKGLIPLGLVNLVCVAVVFTFDLPKHLLSFTAVFLFVGSLISARNLQSTINMPRSAGRPKAGSILSEVTV
jgi:NADH-quinone oxidoreductase subunit H